MMVATTAPRPTGQLSGLGVDRERQRVAFTHLWNRLKATSEDTVGQFLIGRNLRTVAANQFFIEVSFAPGKPINLTEITIQLNRGEWIGDLPIGADSPQEDAEQALSAQIVQRAITTPHLEIPVVAAPPLTNNLVKDVRAFTGLTHRELADIWDVQPRTIQGVQSGEIPAAKYEPVLTALLAIGRILIGGLGAKGVHKWLTIGDPSRLARIANGEIADVQAEARAFMR